MNYGSIYRFSTADGEGCRVVLFVSGCNHHCEDCHNPKTWDLNYGKKFTEDTFNLLVKELKRPEVDGITLSGGDPLYKPNREDILDLVKKIRGIFPEKTIWLYTGYKWDQIADLDIMEYIDVVVDGKYEKDKRDVSIAFRGSSNQRIIDVKSSLKKKEVVELKYD